MRLDDDAGKACKSGAGVESHQVLVADERKVWSHGDVLALHERPVALGQLGDLEGLLDVAAQLWGGRSDQGRGRRPRARA